MRKDNVFQIRLSTKLLEAGKRKAREENLSLAEIIRTLLIDYLEEPEKDENNDEWQ